MASFRTCGGFFDLATAQRRLGELDALMSAESFWNNREQAQKLIDEANTLRGRVDPLIKAEKQLEDFQVMVELAEGEPEARADDEGIVGGRGPGVQRGGDGRRQVGQ